MAFVRMGGNAGPGGAAACSAGGCTAAGGNRDVLHTLGQSCTKLVLAGARGRERIPANTPGAKPSPRGVPAREVTVNESHSNFLINASSRRGDNHGTKPAAKPAARSRGFRCTTVRAGEPASIKGRGRRRDAKGMEGGVCVCVTGLTPALAFRSANEPLSLTPDSPLPRRRPCRPGCGGGGGVPYRWLPWLCTLVFHGAPCT